MVPYLPNFSPWSSTSQLILWYHPFPLYPLKRSAAASQSPWWCVLAWKTVQTQSFDGVENYGETDRRSCAHARISIRCLRQIIFRFHTTSTHPPNGAAKNINEKTCRILRRWYKGKKSWILVTPLAPLFRFVDHDDLFEPCRNDAPYTAKTTIQASVLSHSLKRKVFYMIVEFRSFCLRNDEERDDCSRLFRKDLFDELRQQTTIKQ